MAIFCKYPSLNGLCKTCAGCNLLEDVNFRGKEKCNGYIKLISPGVQTAIKQIHKTLGITGEQLEL